PLNMTNSRSKRHAANDLSEKFATEPVQVVGTFVLVPVNAAAIDLVERLDAQGNVVLFLVQS
ncbi:MULTISPECIES: hypothetical protein, partial [unclassified Mesorhizobium]|uniref:hypothetical protein n=1 Tax=unclassified Mesorhizobium TaxID=325217 RepID=UPI0005184B96